MSKFYVLRATVDCDTQQADDIDTFMTDNLSQPMTLDLALQQAIAHHQAGRLHEAQQLYRTILQADPHHPQARHNLGVLVGQLGQHDAVSEAEPAPAQKSQLIALLETGKLAELEAQANTALSEYPESGFLWGILGASLHMQGKDALFALRKAAELMPNEVAPHNNLAHVLQALGHLDAAAASYGRALEIQPHNAALHFNLGHTLRDIGRREEAVASYRRALAASPDSAPMHLALGVVLHQLGQLDAAVQSYGRALAIDPESAMAHNNLSTIWHHFGRLDEAEASCNRAIQIEPNYPDAHSNLGNVLRDAGQLSRAASSYRRALELKPDYAEAHGNLGTVLLDLGHLEDAVASLDCALELNPHLTDAHSNLGGALAILGRFDDALDSIHRALAIKPDSPVLHSNLLFIHNYLCDKPVAALLEASVRYGEIVCASARPYTEWPKACVSSDCLRVGIVSGDLWSHPVGYFLESVLAELVRVGLGRIEIIAYPTIRKEDMVTTRLKRYFSAWKPLAALSDEAAARLIHDDGIHVLIDLAGHTAANRLPVFAWKPAPIQVSWLGYFATTGLVAMDYVMADPWSLPSSEDQHFTETIWRLPETRLCFTEPDVALPVSVLPALTNQYVTFGCFNNLAKMNDRVVQVWSKILQAVPNSRLFLKAAELQDPSMRARVVARFVACGVAASRLILEGSSPRAQYLAAYHRIDIALDPFPYPGGTVSAECLWMGVPVLTLAGERFLSRQGVGLLMNVGLPDWIASDADDYVARAVSRAGDWQSLSDLRQRLRHQVLASPLFDAPRFARHFETAVRGMWAQFIATQE